MFPGHPSLGIEDIPDPLYANEDSLEGAPSERARLRAAVDQIRAACAGLLRHLLDLCDRLGCVHRVDGQSALLATRASCI